MEPGREAGPAKPDVGVGLRGGRLAWRPGWLPQKPQRGGVCYLPENQLWDFWAVGGGGGGGGAGWYKAIGAVIRPRPGHSDAWPRKMTQSDQRVGRVTPLPGDRGMRREQKWRPGEWQGHP